MKLSPESLVQVLRLAQNKPVALIGAPGIGKTAIVRQVAERLASERGRQFVDLGEADVRVIEQIKRDPSKYFVFFKLVAPRLTRDDISVPVRIQKLDSVNVRHIPPDELFVFSLPGIEGIFFIDELSNVLSDEQMTLFSALVNERSIGWDLHMQSSVQIITAMNPVSDSSLARDLPEIIADRFIKLFVEPDFESWLAYMYQRHDAGTVSRVASFIRQFGMFGYSKYSIRDVPAFTTPRSWEAVVSVLEKASAVDGIVEEMIAGLIGAEPTAKLVEFLRSKVNVDDVLAGKVSFEELTIGEKNLVVGAVAGKLVDAVKAEKWEEVKRLVKFLSDLKGDWRGLAVALVPKEVNLKIASKVPEYVRVANVSR